MNNVCSYSMNVCSFLRNDFKTCSVTSRPCPNNGNNTNCDTAEGARNGTIPCPNNYRR